MSELRSILPPNSGPIEQSFEQVQAQLVSLGTPLSDIWSTDRCPVALLPYLAWAMSVEVWDPRWGADKKRETIRESIGVHRTKGTLSSIKRALAAAGYPEARIVEGDVSSKYDGAILFDGTSEHSEADHWAAYRVYIDRPITNEQADQVREILAGVAPARCHLSGIFYPELSNTYNAAATFDGTFSHGVS